MLIDLNHIDYRMRLTIQPLIQHNQYASAIRAIFAHLATRIRGHCRLPDNVDGADLIHKLFGKGSTKSRYFTESEKQAYRDLFSGTYGVLRNKFMHNDAIPTYLELITAIANANLLLKVIGDFRIAAYDILLLEKPAMMEIILETVIRGTLYSCRGATDLDTARAIVKKHGAPTLVVGERVLAFAGINPSIRTETFVEELRTGIAPRIRAIYVTGYHADKPTLVAPDCEIAKPFRIFDLHLAINENLKQLEGFDD